MTGTGVIDQFLETFTRYIDNGFGLLGGDVGYLATTLAAIDITLAALFWSWGTDEDIIGRLVKKTLFVGVFAYLIGNWNNLARIVFVQALRACVPSDEHPAGWLNALADEKIGAALALMHRDISRQWTVEDLAVAVGMSRSSFALRFKTLVGLAPLEYWLQWRMRLAGRLLRNSNRTVASVASGWGYGSERSFGKAFKRVMGSAPRGYRKTAH